MSESFQDQLSRLECMADDDTGMTWDLSDNDRAAISAVLTALTAANAIIATAQRLLELVDLDDEADQADYERVMAWEVRG